MNNIKNDNLLRRLVFIKYLYKFGIEQSLKPEPMCCISILTFHDAVELFLQLTSEYLNVGKKTIHFMEYFTLISNKIEGKDLSQKESIRRLNTARVSLKHHGNLPSKFDVDNFSISVTNFFVENTSFIFKLEFEAISLLDLIILFKNTKESLIQATTLIKEKDYDNALKKITKAFEQLKNDFSKNFPLNFHGEHFFTSRMKNLIQPYQYNLDSEIIRSLNDTNQKIFKHIDDLNNSMTNIENIVLLLSMVVNYKKYIKFDYITPTIYQTLNGNYHFQVGPNYEKDVNIKNVQYCFDFVLESAITLQGMFENID